MLAEDVPCGHVSHLIAKVGVFTTAVISIAWVPIEYAFAIVMSPTRQAVSKDESDVADIDQAADREVPQEVEEVHKDLALQAQHLADQATILLSRRRTVAEGLRRRAHQRSSRIGATSIRSRAQQ